jgi:ABC-type uncharacterized transport system involved in gliding motility auxiliary subunit
MGLVMTNAADRREAIPFLDPSQEPVLEYEVIRALATLRSGDRPKVGVLTSLPMAGSGGGASGGMMMQQQPTPAWVTYRQMQAFYEVIDIDTSAEQLPEALDALVIVHPENLGEPMLRSINRYVVGGGKLLLFYDGFCEAAASGGNPMMGMMGSPAAPSSMGPFPGVWGVDLAMGKFAADVKLAPRVPTGRSQNGGTLPYLALMDLSADQIDRDSLITRSVSRLILATPGALQLTDKPGITAQTLIQTSDGGSTLDTGLVSVMPSPAAMLQSFLPGEQAIPLMVRLTGTFPSAYTPGSDAPATDSTEADTPATQPEELLESKPGEVILISDADFLQDPYWLQQAGPFGFQPIADNGNLLLNALELLTGDAVLAGLKPRGRYQRPFEVVEQLRRDAESRFLSRQQQLENDINQTQRKLTELQSIKPDEQLAVLSPEQEQEIERLQEQVIAARSELRQVRYDLNREIDSLGQKLMVLNVLLWPLLVFSVAMLWWTGRVITGGQSKQIAKPQRKPRAAKVVAEKLF